MRNERLHWHWEALVNTGSVWGLGFLGRTSERTSPRPQHRQPWRKRRLSRMAWTPLKENWSHNNYNNIIFECLLQASQCSRVHSSLASLMPVIASWREAASYSPLANGLSTLTRSHKQEVAKLGFRHRRKVKCCVRSIICLIPFIYCLTDSGKKEGNRWSVTWSHVSYLFLNFSFFKYRNSLLSSPCHGLNWLV